MRKRENKRGSYKAMGPSDVYTTRRKEKGQAGDLEGAGPCIGEKQDRYRLTESQRESTLQRSREKYKDSLISMTTL